MRTDAEVDRVLIKDGKAYGVVLTNGVFDLLHTGHLFYLQQARALGAEWLATLGSLNRATWALTADVGAAGLWLGVCVAGATVTWLAGNSVLLATRSFRR
mgnify:CR=1 FL=1